jgi:hypothetical protein
MRQEDKCPVSLSHDHALPLAGGEIVCRESHEFPNFTWSNCEGREGREGRRQSGNGRVGEWWEEGDPDLNQIASEDGTGRDGRGVSLVESWTVSVIVSLVISSSLRPQERERE